MKQKNLLEFKHELYNRLFPGFVGNPFNLFIKEQFNDKPLVGMEIGVYHGINTYNMFRLLNIREMFCVDPWLVEDDLRWTKQILSSFNHRIVYVKDYDYKVYSIVPDDYFDFIYADGDQTYTGVKRTLELFYPKIRSGGVIGGHAFMVAYRGVVDAVFEFEQNHPDIILGGHNDDWWFVKK